MSQRILVTGGAGFLGSFLCEQLIQQGDDVLALDNLFTGNKRNIAHLLDNQKFEFIRHDVVEPIMLEVDWIFNLACPEQARGVGWLRIELVELLSLTPAQQIFLLAKVSLFYRLLNSSFPNALLQGR